MMFFAKARTILGLLPVIIGTIKSLEEAIPGTGKGEQKLAMIRAALEAAHEAAEDATDSFESIWPGIAATVAKIVATFNALGGFRKG